MQWLLTTCKWYEIAPKDLIPGANDKHNRQMTESSLKSNRSVNLLRVSASTAVSLQLMWLSYFVNRPYNTLPDYVTFLLCCIFEYQVDTTLKRDFNRFGWNPGSFQIQWRLLDAVLFTFGHFNLNDSAWWTEKYPRCYFSPWSEWINFTWVLQSICFSWIYQWHCLCWGFWVKSLSSARLYWWQSLNLFMFHSLFDTPPADVFSRRAIVWP